MGEVGGRLWEAVAMTESTVLGFQKKHSSFFCSIKGLLRAIVRYDLG